MKSKIYFFLRKCYFVADDLLYRVLLLLPHRRIKTAESNAKRVVFVVDHPSPRVMKMAKELRKNGWEIISLCRIKRGKVMAEDIYRYSTKVETYVSAHGALYRCRHYQGGLFHVFCCYVYDVPTLLIKKRIGKIIFDNYDGFAGFLSKWDKTRANRKTAKAERFCLENADGLTCRSFETQYNKWRMGYRFKGKRLLFLDYCSTESKRYLHEHELNESPVFFYGGGLPDEINKPDYVHSCIVDAAQALSEHGCGLWVYHSRCSPELDVYYQKAAERIPAFLFHGAVPFEEMLAVMKQCDFSIMPVKKQFETNIKENRNDGTYYGVKMKYGTANKYFDALEAGLPLVGASFQLVFSMLERSGVACRCTVEELGDRLEYLKKHHDEYCDNIAQQIDKFSVEKNISRLIDFYRKIAVTSPTQIDVSK